MEEAVRFASGDIELEGLFSTPAGRDAQIAAVICHPHPLYGGDMQNGVVSALVEAFGSSGIATLRFNFRGVGGSGGRHDEGRGEAGDVAAAISFLLARTATATMVVAGYSFGAMVGLQAGAQDTRVHKLIGVGLPIARRAADFLEGLGKPLLLISGDQDDISPAERLHELVVRLAEPKSLVIIPGADHFLAGREREVAAAATDFLTPAAE